MQRPGGGLPIAAALAALLACLWAGAGAARAQSTIAAQVSATTVGQPLPGGFVGISAEYWALRDYTGSASAIDPVLVALLRGLAPGQEPYLRVGGDSADQTWWPVKHLATPKGVSYRLTKDWLRSAHALQAATRARLIMGINLAFVKPPLAAAEAKAILRYLGRRAIYALEIGNEPDLYGMFTFYRSHGRRHTARGHGYGLSSYIRDFSRWRAALPVAPLAGPAFAGLTWMTGLDQFLAAEPGLRAVTFHRYPLRGCQHDPNGPGYPTLPALLSDDSAAGLAQEVAPYVSTAHQRGIPFRLDELNSVACRGRRGVSDTFAAALWALDTLFNLASVGVDGVNFHTLPGAAYELFTISHRGRAWHAFVRPEYYGLLAFARSFPPGALLLAVNAPAGPVKVWATQAPDGRVRVAVINKDANNAYDVQLQLPGAQTAASAQVLIAPTISSSSGVVIGGQTFGPDTTTGRLTGAQQSTPVNPGVGGSYTVSVPGGSAVLLTK